MKIHRISRQKLGIPSENLAGVSCCASSRDDLYLDQGTRHVYRRRWKTGIAYGKVRTSDRDQTWIRTRNADKWSQEMCKVIAFLSQGVASGTTEPPNSHLSSSTPEALQGTSEWSSPSTLTERRPSYRDFRLSRGVILELIYIWSAPKLFQNPRHEKNDSPKVMLMLTSVFSTIFVNSSKLIFPSRSRSASMIVLSTICCNC